MFNRTAKQRVNPDLSKTNKPWTDPMEETVCLLALKKIWIVQASWLVAVNGCTTLPGFLPYVLYRSPCTIGFLHQMDFTFVFSDVI